MPDQPARLPSPFTAQERDLIRREMGMRFGQLPSLADGLFLRTWRGGEHRGEPKIPPAVRTMLERGLEVSHGVGVGALGVHVEISGAMSPARFAHLRRELGLDAPENDLTR